MMTGWGEGYGNGDYVAPFRNFGDGVGYQSGGGDGNGHPEPVDHWAWGEGIHNPPSVTNYHSNDNLGALMYVMGVIHGGQMSPTAAGRPPAQPGD